MKVKACMAGLVVEGYGNQIGKDTLYVGTEDNKMPWGDKPASKADGKFFREYTKDNVLVMGRKTWESLPCKLKGCKHVVISSTLQDLGGDNNPEVILNYVPTQEVLEGLSEWFGNGEICVIGGIELIHEMTRKGLIDEIMFTEFRKEAYPTEETHSKLTRAMQEVKAIPLQDSNYFHFTDNHLMSFEDMVDMTEVSHTSSVCNIDGIANEMNIYKFTKKENV